MPSSLLHKTLRVLTRLFRAKDGVILIKTALLIVPLIGMLGIGVDVSRVYLYRSHLSGALDAAILAGGKAFHSSTRDAEINAFFDLNFNQNYMGGSVGELTITEIDSTTKSLTVSATGSIPATFVSLFGFGDIAISASAEITSKITGLQLVMVLDSTGSMRQSSGGVSRMTSLKSAANTLVNALFGQETVSTELEIAIVPYVTTVNVAHLLNSSYIDMSGMPSSYTYNPNDLRKWSGCVEARSTNSALDSSAYDVQAEHSGVDWVPFLWRPHYDNHFYSLVDLNGPNGENWPVPDYQLQGGSGENTSDAGPNINCPAPVMDFSNDKYTITTYIDNLYYSYNRGGTIANLGMVWGWRMLHTGAPFFNTTPYNDSETLKAAILMTDGENWIINSKGEHHHYNGENRFSDTSNHRYYRDNNDDFDDDADGSCPDCSTKAWDSDDENTGPDIFDANNGTNIGRYYIGDYSGYGRRDEGRLEGATTRAASTTAINKRLAYVCAAMQGMGITIYTITFGNGASNAELQNLYRGCATDQGKYFHAPSSSELEGAFEAIANDLSNLRLSR